MIGWWRDHTDLGVLPYPGSMSDQPAFVVEAIRTCINEQRTLEAERLRPKEKVSV